MPQFAGSNNTDHEDSKRFEGVFDVICTDAGYYKKGMNWREKQHIADAVAVETNPQHALMLKFKFKGKEHENYLSLFGQENRRGWSEWEKVYKAFNLTAKSELRDAIGRTFKVLFYAGKKGYSDVWTRVFPSSASNGEVENAFLSSLEKSSYMRGKVAGYSRYLKDAAMPDKEPDEELDKDLPF